jgi:hypothetical protein
MSASRPCTLCSAPKSSEKTSRIRQASEVWRRSPAVGPSSTWPRPTAQLEEPLCLCGFSRVHSRYDGGFSGGTTDRPLKPAARKCACQTFKCVSAAQVGPNAELHAPSAGAAASLRRDRQTPAPEYWASHANSGDDQKCILARVSEYM